MINETVTNNLISNEELATLGMTREDRLQAISRIRDDARKIWTLEKMERYNKETALKNYTNCYAYAIGATCTVSDLYRPGMISGAKGHKAEFVDEYELMDCFRKDCQRLNLPFTQIITKEATQLARFERDYDFNANEHMIGLFSLKYYDGVIRGFHFIRYDPEIGWSEKKDFGGYASKIEDLKSVISKAEYTLAGAFIIHRKDYGEDEAKPMGGYLS